MVCWERRLCFAALLSHQQRQAPRADAHLTSSVVVPPDSEVVAPVSIRTPLGIRPGPFSLVEPCRVSMEDYGVLVGRTLVDASSWSARVLVVSPSSEVVVLPSFSCVFSVGSLRGVRLAEEGGWRPAGPPK